MVFRRPFVEGVFFRRTSEAVVFRRTLKEKEAEQVFVVLVMEQQLEPLLPWGVRGAAEGAAWGLPATLGARGAVGDAVMLGEGPVWVRQAITQNDSYIAVTSYSRSRVKKSGGSPARGEVLATKDSSATEGSR